MTSISFQYPTDVVGTRNNKGFHDKGKRNYKKAVTTIKTCLQTYKEARLYHLCFVGRTNTEHKEALKLLIQHLQRHDIPNEWFSARETDAVKGEHLHAFLLVDASKVNTASILNTFEDQFLGAMCRQRGIDICVNRPRNDSGLHGLNRFIAMPYQGPGNRQTELGTDRLKDGLLWLTYIYKARGKPDIDDEKKNGRIFSASRPNRRPRKQLAAPAIMAPDRPIVVTAVLASTELH